ncbi:MAG: 3-hydroxyacyl-CoA dehydrogenase NAD-binding domain-containing protein, partial [Gammaproteobacteria bacterium]
MYKHLTITVDAEGIALLKLDVAGKPMNVFEPEFNAELAAAVAQLVGDAAVGGIVITSGKEAFVAGADIKDIVSAYDRGITAAEAAGWSRQLSGLFRRLETCGKPVAAAINGLALGGGLELALACHYRVLADDPKAVVGLPEVKIGLLPGAGGTQRLPRLIGVMEAAKLMTDGNPVSPAQAKKLGIVHELAPTADVVARARAWLLTRPEPVAPWDRKGFRIPGGGNLTSPAVTQTMMGGTALLAKATLRNYPAPQEILAALYEGCAVPFDKALEVESKHFGRLLSGPVARNLMRTMFVNKGLVDKLSRRPADVPKWRVHKLGILGAGMMGAGIAHVSALAGMEVVLLDSTQAAAEKGKAYSAKLLQKEVDRGRRTEASRDAVLARITPTTDYALLKGCELVIEAVFEDRAIKAEVTARTEAVIGRDAVFASNTSTLPITGLAKASKRPANFIGIHFFSPVERMPLVEIIRGKRTSIETVARALDYVGQLRKTPIVVNDSRGFFTSRVFGTYCAEGARMLEEGILPALIENAGRMAGMPVGPLAVTDEVSLELNYKVMKQTAADLGAKHEPSIAWPVVRHLVEDLGRLGRKSGGGYYEYPADGGPKRLWSGLATEYPPRADQPTVEELKQRLLHIQALETARCVEEGVLESSMEG